MPPPSSRPPGMPREVVGPLVRGLALLRALASGGGARQASELAKALGVARSSVDRLVSTLARLGYVRLDGREVALAPRLAELGNAYIASTGLADRLGGLADRLADELDESVSLAVPDRDGVRFVHQATRRRAMSLTFRTGDLLPAERGAPGALFAADWDEEQWAAWRARREADAEDETFGALPPPHVDAASCFARRIETAGERGWSLDDELIEPGLLALAMPVRDAGGEQVCAVSVVSHTSRHSAESLEQAVLGRLTGVVAEMSEALRAPSRQCEESGNASARTREPKRELGPEFVESLARGLAVLTALADGSAPLTRVAEATGLARATARRSLLTLEHLGYVVAGGGGFRLTPRVLELGFAQLSGYTLAQLAEPHLARLVAQVRESASLSVLRGGEIQYIARVPTVRIMSVNITVGTRFPAYATSMGRVLLAGLPAAARRALLRAADPAPLTERTVTSARRLDELVRDADRAGYALVDDELEEGLRSLAVPIRDGSGRVVAAANVSTHSGRSTPQESRSALLPSLREAAAAIEADLGVLGRYVRIPAG
ncbi:IclR family transcriptional regulator domain-containing protein [Streptomyces xiaopingdaonensis]|uniref:IclR family transcriptional regulator domain-containing protein n=1 Tax=Streptomyces xiaopingdaonensis TaxID=1565415 RepID=UPI000494BC11|nr:IclR family transcriptional regulator C-terminal domain-containing protein [Streptomyces xiaopingdaonensis]